MLKTRSHRERPAEIFRNRIAQTWASFRWSALLGALALLLILAGLQANAEEKKPPPPPKGSALEAIQKGNIPYLGPGADKMAPDAYQKHYGDYIKEAISMGFPPSKCDDGACDQSIQQLFRKSGLFDYPVPGAAQVKSFKNRALECYMVGGVLAQVTRNRNRQLLHAIVVFSRSPKAMPTLWRACKEAPMRVQSAQKSGLEKLAGIPVGYPHPYLCGSSQGLYVRQLSFVQEGGDCRAVSYRDNSWANGNDVDEQMCRDIQQDVEYVWQEKLKPHEFVKRERQRTRRRLRARAIAQGATRGDANLLIRKLYAGPLDHDFTYVGIAMRNLEACNRFVVGGLDFFQRKQSGKLIPRGQEGGRGGEKGGSGDSGSGKTAE